MKYRILSARSQESIEAKVNDRIKLGWRPLGGVKIILIEKDLYYIQTMILGGQ